MLHEGLERLEWLRSQQKRICGDPVTILGGLGARGFRGIPTQAAYLARGRTTFDRRSINPLLHRLSL